MDEEKFAIEVKASGKLYSSLGLEKKLLNLSNQMLISTLKVSHAKVGASVSCISSAVRVT